MKREKIIAIFVFVGGIFLLVSGIFLSQQTVEKKEEKNETPSIDEKEEVGENIEKPQNTGKKLYQCQSELLDKVQNEIPINYKVKSKYQFLITEEKKIISDGYEVTFLFQSIEDLNAYYDNFIDGDPFYNPNNTTVSKNEEDYTITVHNTMVLGGVETFTDEYLDQLSKLGYTCQLGEMNTTDNPNYVVDTK